ncbi:histidine--tRNA ligase [Candidatus Woesebacteria bacterium RIFOXYB1_FULL_38_16]|uniref:Histidine--tRNA ligase n=1 Tax=Candidatus Woesebacteria bacterium RIFOXYB1_FULL_38_16 TaxID=1802538 RepID=A0A1F8CR41_9BACT|nr:MAG: histidine--tRNA ligase [Candidatus Woesebacteria bacterium RIFOXYB1_FULL_38_16]
MSEEQKVGNFRGTADFLGKQAKLRLEVMLIMRRAFERFGFEPLETPEIELKKVLQGTGGDEAESSKYFKLVKYVDMAEAGLRFDHTVPLARAITMHWNQFITPYKRYAIGPVFRNEGGAGAGRWSRFIQCDFDTVGSASPVVDAEIVAINYSILTELGFGNQFITRLNDRRLLNAMVSAMGITSSSDQVVAILRSWDKLDRTEMRKCRKDLLRSGLCKNDIYYLEDVTRQLVAVCGQPTEQVVAVINSLFPTEDVAKALGDIEVITGYIDSFGVPKSAYQFWPLLSRGLAYYTGPIFETVVNGISGSISGGGRFDKLIANMGGPDMAASGSSFGLERVIAVMEELGISPNLNLASDVFVTLFDLGNQDLCEASFAFATKLRLTGYKVEVYTGDAQSLGKQLNIASRKGIPIVVIIGPEELNSGQVTIKNLKEGAQERLSPDKAVEIINWWLNT